MDLPGLLMHVATLLEAGHVVRGSVELEDRLVMWVVEGRGGEIRLRVTGVELLEDPVPWDLVDD